MAIFSGDDKVKVVRTPYKGSISDRPLEQLVSADATHYLHCRHCIGQSCRNYVMRAVLLGETLGGKLKLLVFGDRHWKGRDHIRRVRYVDRDKVSQIEGLND